MRTGEEGSDCGVEEVSGREAGRQADPICGHLGPDPGKRPAGVRWRTPGKTVSPVRRIALYIYLSITTIQLLLPD